MYFNVEDIDDQPFRVSFAALLMAKRPKEMIRGLRSRVLYSKAYITCLFDSDRADQLLLCAGIDATLQGAQDARDAVVKPPVTYAGASFLRRCWKAGFDDEVFSQEQLGCRQWHDGSGNRCPIHG